MDRLKASQTVLPSDENGYIFVTNINIPTVYFQVPDIVQRAKDFVNRDYLLQPDEQLPSQVYFEISASYQLVHAESQTQRQWVGSFSPKQNFALTPILEFVGDFEDAIRPLLNLNYLRDKISRLGQADSVWKVQSVTSLIVNVQSAVPPNHPTLRSKDLVSGHNGVRIRRRVKEYDLP